MTREQYDEIKGLLSKANEKLFEDSKTSFEQFDPFDISDPSAHDKAVAEISNKLMEIRNYMAQNRDILIK